MARVDRALDMDVTKELDALRAEVAGCELVAFADLSSEMVLCVSSASRHAQEEIDALSVAAATLLQEGISAEVGAFTGEGGNAMGGAITMTADQVRIFLRSSQEANEVLCCLCAPNVEVHKIMDCGRSVLDRIVSQN